MCNGLIEILCLFEFVVFFGNKSVIDQSCQLSNDGLLGCRIVWLRLEEWNLLDINIVKVYLL